MAVETFFTLEEKVHPDHAAVVIIDMQNDFCSPQGETTRHTDIPKCQALAQAVATRLRPFLDRARRAGVRIIHVRRVLDPNHITGPMEELTRRRGRSGYTGKRGSWGADFFEDICPQGDELVVEKPHYSAFIGTQFDTLLRQRGISTLVLVGVATHVCVGTTAQDAFQRGFYVVLCSDLTAGADEEAHSAALLNIERHFGVSVPSEEVLRIWEAVS